MSLKIITTLLKIIIALIIFPSSNSCYTHYAVVNSEPFQKFSLPPGNQCWDYCKVLEDCQTLTISLDKLSECSLYKERRSEIDYHTDSDSLAVILSKRCLSRRTTRDSEETLKRSQETGLVIQSLDTGRCMEVNISGYGGLNKKEPVGYPLFWSSACEQTWELRSVTTNGRPDYFGCKKTTVQLKNTNMCIALLYSVELMMSRAFLHTCTSAEETEEQILLLCAANSLETDGEWSLMQYLPLYNSITLGSVLSINGTINLDRIRLSTVKELKDPTVACIVVKAENGRALLDVSVPVFLPGERITVECDEGFGVRGDNETYDNYSYTTTCSEHMDLDQCSPLPKKMEQRCSNLEDLDRVTERSDSDRDRGTFLLVFVGLILFLDH